MWRRKPGPESLTSIVRTMTAARQQRKSGLALALPLGLALASGIGARAAAQAVPERTVVNFHTGLGLSGFDPVAYFTDNRPKFGRPEMEYSRGGVVWRFANEGNRAAFVENPEVYAPRFGGYDPVAIARGTSVPGHPLFWTVAAGRLYLFYNDAARRAFIADPGRYIESAERKWPEVARGIGG
jgi:YHS domain-containing protein